jgi:hypothetical protein
MLSLSTEDFIGRSTATFAARAEERETEERETEERETEEREDTTVKPHRFSRLNASSLSNPYK